MKKSSKHLRQNDRDRIEAMLNEGFPQKIIAKILGVHKSTISREIKKRKRRNGYYSATTAQQKAGVKRSRSKYQGMKVESMPNVREYIIAELKKKRSPDEIAGRMKRDRLPFRVGKDAIYRWLYSARGQRYCPYLCTKRYKVKPRKNKSKREMIPNRTSIHERPLGAANKSRYKHFESDTAVAPRRVDNNEAVALSTEIKSKLILAKKIPSLSPKEMAKAMQSFSRRVYMLSTTTDNGIENKYHEDWGVSTYFADAHSPWQKPLVENSIGLLRRWFFKKGTDWTEVSDAKLQEAITTLNNKYRKSLNYASAMEVALANDIMKKTPI